MGKGFALSSPNTPDHSEDAVKVCGKSDQKGFLQKKKVLFDTNLSGRNIMKAPDSFFSLVLEEDHVFSTW